MRRFGDGFQITVKVRLMHARVRRMLLATGKWDSTKWGVPINQHDMAATTLLFSLSVLDGLRDLGFRITDEEAHSYMQLWRYVGRVIGVDPEILPTSEQEARDLADMMEVTMGDPDEDSRALVRALFEHAVARARNDRQRANLIRRAQFGYGLSRSLIGDERADKLGIPRNRFRYIVPALRRVVSAAETIRTRSSIANRVAYASGMQFWDNVVRIGLADATAEFRLPDRLAIR
jgi:hypothetical protein